MADDTQEKLTGMLRSIDEAITAAVDPGVLYDVEEGLGTIPEPRDVPLHGMQVVARYHETIDVAVHSEILITSIMGDPRVRTAVERAERTRDPDDGRHAHDVAQLVAAEHIEEHHRACASCRDAAARSASAIRVVG